MNTIALIEVGDQTKESYYFIKGEPPTEKVPADIYWYEDSVKVEELAQEIEDLKEFYEIVGIILPIPKEIEKELII